MDLRCPHKKHGVVLIPASNDAMVEIQCRSRWCGAAQGVVVMHRFSLRDGLLVETTQYKSATQRRE